MQSDLIYDVGMNNGDDTAYYLHKGFRVVAIEADPTLIENARSRFAAEIQAGKLTLVHAAIGPADGKATFWICEGKSEWNSFDRSIASRLGRQHHALEVATRRFSGLLREHGVPYYLKIDIEGHDHYCAADIDPAHAPRFVSLELDRLEDLVLLRERGYNAFKLITQNDFSPLTIRELTFKQRLKRSLSSRPFLARIAGGLGSIKGSVVRLLSEPSSAKRPRSAGWEFPLGSSGPFGDDTAGAWMGLEQTAFTWLHYRLGKSEYGEPSLSVWHDVHATRLEPEPSR